MFIRYLLSLVLSLFLRKKSILACFSYILYFSFYSSYFTIFCKLSPFGNLNLFRYYASISVRLNKLTERFGYSYIFVYVFLPINAFSLGWFTKDFKCSVYFFCKYLLLSCFLDCLFLFFNSFCFLFCFFFFLSFFNLYISSDESFGCFSEEESF